MLHQALETQAGKNRLEQNENRADDNYFAMILLNPRNFLRLSWIDYSAATFAGIGVSGVGQQVIDQTLHSRRSADNTRH